MLTLAGDQLVIADLGSVNGTTVNGEFVSGPRTLRPGDVVRLGATELLVAGPSMSETRLMAAIPPRPDWGPVATSGPRVETRPWLPATAQAGPDRGTSRSDFRPALRHIVVDAFFSGASAVCLALLGTPAAGAAGGALAVAFLSEFAQQFAQASGPWRGARIALTGLVAYLAAGGVITIPEIALGHAIADAERPSTYLPPAVVTKSSTRPPPPTTAPLPERKRLAIDVSPNPLDCGEVPAGETVRCKPEITVKSTGTEPLSITEVDPPNPAGEFTVDKSDCMAKRELATGETCAIRIEFTPEKDVTGEAKSVRSARIVIHQNLPKPDTGTEVTLTGTALVRPVLPTSR